MRSACTLITLMTLALGLSCSGKKKEMTVEVVKAEDPVMVSPGNYKILQETPQVRLLLGTFKPGERDRFHSHPAAVVYALTDGAGKGHAPDGGSKAVEISAGMSTAQPAIKSHSFENTGSKDVQFLVFEVKEAGKGGVPRDAAPPATEASPEVYKVLAENEALRLVMGTFPPGKRDEFHSHPPVVAYVTVGGKAKGHMPDGKSREMKVESGMSVIQPAIKSHSLENVGKSEIRVVMAEVK